MNLQLPIETVNQVLGYTGTRPDDAWRFGPCTLHAAVRSFAKKQSGIMPSAAMFTSATGASTS